MGGRGDQRGAGRTVAPAGLQRSGRPEPTGRVTTVRPVPRRKRRPPRLSAVDTNAPAPPRRPMNKDCSTLGRATSEMRKKKEMRTLNGGVWHKCRDQSRGRGLSSGELILPPMEAVIRVRAGHRTRIAAPSGAGRQACGTERVVSPAPNHGVLRGIPAEGVDGDSKAAPAQGKAFP